MRLVNEQVFLDDDRKEAKSIFHIKPAEEASRRRLDENQGEAEEESKRVSSKLCEWSE